jgi:hypothetical protein
LEKDAIEATTNLAPFRSTHLWKVSSHHRLMIGIHSPELSAWSGVKSGVHQLASLTDSPPREARSDTHPHVHMTRLRGRS